MFKKNTTQIYKEFINKGYFKFKIEQKEFKDMKKILISKIKKKFKQKNNRFKKISL